LSLFSGFKKKKIRMRSSIPSFSNILGSMLRHSPEGRPIRTCYLILTTVCDILQRSGGLDDFSFAGTPVDETLACDIDASKFLAQQRDVVLVDDTSNRKTRLLVEFSAAYHKRLGHTRNDDPLTARWSPPNAARDAFQRPRYSIQDRHIENTVDC
jgi:hypothetical protein